MHHVKMCAAGLFLVGRQHISTGQTFARDVEEDVEFVWLLRPVEKWCHPVFLTREQIKVVAQPLHPASPPYSSDTFSFIQ